MFSGQQCKVPSLLLVAYREGNISASPSLHLLLAVIRQEVPCHSVQADICAVPVSKL